MAISATHRRPKVHPIRAARTKRGMSQGALGHRVGAGRAAVSKWESGGAFPEPRAAFRIAAELQISLEDVYASARGR
jgi:DNA-binding XRE family transcriptional regulator